MMIEMQEYVSLLFFLSLFCVHDFSDFFFFYVAYV
jgi:hypothetical protein